MPKLRQAEVVMNMVINIKIIMIIIILLLLLLLSPLVSLYFWLTFT